MAASVVGAWQHILMEGIVSPQTAKIVSAAKSLLSFLPEDRQPPCIVAERSVLSAPEHQLRFMSCHHTVKDGNIFCGELQLGFSGLVMASSCVCLSMTYPSQSVVAFESALEKNFMS